jgi:uncharacterized cupin superfamily protein
MSLRRLNILELEPDEALDEAGFRHRQIELGPRLGSQQIHATLYAAQARTPIWPYHYHHGVEEWLYVTAGLPLLRDHAGRRPLQPGDLTCFPSGPAGAHTLEGPGRFMILSTGTEREPWMSVYPDSGKVSGPEGILLASSRVEYWYGEGTWESSPDVRPDEPPGREFSRPASVNLNAMAATEAPARGAPPGFATRQAPLGPQLGAVRLGATLYEVDPGEGTAPYHYHSGREEWLLVLAGTPSVRHPDGEDRLTTGDVVCFPDGPAGAHRILNRSSEPVRLILISTVALPVTAHYPDSGKVLIRETADESYVFRIADGVDYWDGEADPR